MRSRRPARGRRLARWCVALACILAATAAAAASFELPPINQPPTADHHPGKVIWVDLVTPDLARAERFYGGLFGWTFDIIHTGRTDYAVARLDGTPVAGIVQRPIPAGTQRHPAWLTFIAIGNVRNAAKTIIAQGGQLLSPVRDYPQRGLQAVFRDPQGATFAILESQSGDSPDELADRSDWIWSALVTSDPETDAAFYQKVFGYEVFPMSGGDSAEHLVLASDQFARASVNAFPEHDTGSHPHWIDFIRVGSVTDAAARAKALGGRVLVEPHRGRSGNFVAVLADPAGAPFGVLEWTGGGAQEAK